MLLYPVPQNANQTVARLNETLLRIRGFISKRSDLGLWALFWNGKGRKCSQNIGCAKTFTSQSCISTKISTITDWTTNLEEISAVSRHLIEESIQKNKLVKLLADLHSVGLLLHFLRDIKVGYGETEAERASEWSQNMDQDGANKWKNS